MRRSLGGELIMVGWSMGDGSRAVSRSTWAALIGASCGGIALGAAAKLADESRIAGLGDLNSYLGAWIVLATLIAAWSSTRSNAALRVGAFMLAMVGTYYAITQWLFGIFPTSHFITWAAASLLLSPLFAALTWASRQRGWVPAFSAAIPIGLLLSEAYSFRWVLSLHLSQFAFDVAAAAVLFVVLPKDWSQRTRVLIIVPAVLLTGIGMQRVVPYIAGVLSAFGLRL